MLKSIVMAGALLATSAHATSFMRDPFGSPGFSNPGFGNPRFNPVIERHVKQDLDRLSQIPGLDSEKEKAMAEQLKKLLANFKDGDHSPVYIDPKTGEHFPLTVTPDPGNPAELKGCISRTRCRGTGDDKECETYEVCISSD